MMLRVVLAAAVIGGIVYFLLPRPLFVIAVRAGKIVVKKGKVSSRFLQECEAMVTTLEIPDCIIRGYRTSTGVSLRFSKSLPAQYHQNFRNVWHLNE